MKTIVIWRNPAGLIGALPWQWAVRWIERGQEDRYTTLADGHADSADAAFRAAIRDFEELDAADEIARSRGAGVA